MMFIQPNGGGWRERAETSRDNLTPPFTPLNEIHRKKRATPPEEKARFYSRDNHEVYGRRPPADCSELD